MKWTSTVQTTTLGTRLWIWYGWRNYDVLPFYKMETRKYGPFKVIGMDESKKKYYRLGKPLSIP